MTHELYYDELQTPIGTLLVLVYEGKVIRIDFGTFHDQQDQLIQWTSRYLKDAIFTRDKIKTSFVMKELDEYFYQGRKQFTVSIKLFGTQFQQRVWQSLYETTPYGTTKTYQELAIAINHPKAVRAIGGALNKNPIAIVVPCHRIIGKNNHLVGFGGGIEKKQWLLAHEGVNICS